MQTGVLNIINHLFLLFAVTPSSRMIFGRYKYRPTPSLCYDYYCPNNIRSYHHHHHHHQQQQQQRQYQEEKEAEAEEEIKIVGS